MKVSEIEGVLTLEQLYQMQGQRVLIPETTYGCGYFGVVNTFAKRVTCIDRQYPHNYYAFCDYGTAWVAVKDPYGIVDLTQEWSKADV